MSGFVRLIELESVNTVHGRDDIEIFRRKLRLEKANIRENVVDDQNPGGHCGLLRKLSTVLRKLITEMGFEI